MTALSTDTIIAWTQHFGEWFNLTIPEDQFADVVASDAFLAEDLSSFDLTITLRLNDDGDLTEEESQAFAVFYVLLDRLGDCVSKYLLGRPWPRHPNDPDILSLALRPIGLNEAAEARGWDTP